MRASSKVPVDLLICLCTIRVETGVRQIYGDKRRSCREDAERLSQVLSSAVLTDHFA